MSGINHILDLASRALLNEQVGVEVTGHNIANVNTPGYSRQQVHFEAALPLPSPWGPLGDGVKIQSIQRAFDPFITARLDEKTATCAEYQARKAFLDQVASLFNETNEAALNDRLSAFWASWHDLANNPAGTAERQALLQNAQSLCEILNFQGDRLVQERASLVQQLSPLLSEINAHAARIAQLNVEIQAAEAGGQWANDLRDQRQREISQLAELVGVRYYTGGDGLINVSLANGISLVQGARSWTLDFTVAPDDSVTVRWNGPNGVREDITASLSGGRLAALLAVRDSLLVTWQQNLDRIAQELIAAVNGQHSKGVGLDLFASVTGTYAVDNPDAPLAGCGLSFGDRLRSGSVEILLERNGSFLAGTTIAVAPDMTLNDLVQAINTDPGVRSYLTASLDGNRLKITANQTSDTFGFSRDTSGILLALGLNTFFAGDKAYTLALNPWIWENPGLIAAGQFDPDGARAPGDNRNALALADLESAPVGPEGLTFAEAYRRLVTDIGLETEQSGQEADFYEKLVQQLTQMRDAVSGVSLDEELSNLIKFQRAYQAAARLISVADELYQTLLTLKR